jgi:CBS domain-containing protein
MEYLVFSMWIIIHSKILFDCESELRCGYRINMCRDILGVKYFSCVRYKKNLAFGSKMFRKVKDWMSSPVIVVDPDSSESHALTLMRRRGIHSLMVDISAENPV